MPSFVHTGRLSIARETVKGFEKLFFKALNFARGDFRTGPEISPEGPALPFVLMGITCRWAGKSPVLPRG